MIKMFYNSENKANEISDFLNTSVPYFKEEYTRYIESVGSEAIYNISTPEKIYNNARCQGFYINGYEVLPISLMDVDNENTIMNMIMIIKD